MKPSADLLQVIAAKHDVGVSHRERGLQDAWGYAVDNVVPEAPGVQSYDKSVIDIDATLLEPSLALVTAHPSAAV